MIDGYRCEQGRLAVHRRLDGDPIDTADLARLEAHLSECESCADLDRELSGMQRGLRSLPELGLPEDVLQRVLDRTARKSAWPSFSVWAAIAATVLTVLFGGWWVAREAPTEPTDAELLRASRDVRRVLRLTSAALKRTEQAAFRDVLGEEFGDALLRAPVEWPGVAAGEQRGP